MRLALCGVDEKHLEKFQKMSGFSQWAVNLSKSKLEDSEYMSRNSDLIYLSADAEEDLDLNDLHKDNALIIGGLVDRNRHKGLTERKAKSLGIRTAKLPIAQFIEMSFSQVLTVNQVVDIVASAFSDRSWEQAIRKVIPQRKKI